MLGVVLRLRHARDLIYAAPSESHENVHSKRAEAGSNLIVRVFLVPLQPLEHGGDFKAYLLGVNE